MAMRIAVIGGTGFVGRHIVDELTAAGHTALAVARRPVAGWHQGFQAADATRIHGLDGVIAGCDAVVWSAGSLRQSRGQTFHDIHDKGVRNLVASCRAARVRRVIHLSSLGARPRSRSAFHRAKFAGEEFIRRSLLDVTVLRPSAIFGVGDDFTTPLARMLRRMPIALFPGDGAACLAPVAATDVARAVRLVLERSDTIGAAYDLPGPEVLPIGEIYNRMMRAIGLRRPKLGMPYLLIEPLSHLFRSSPGVPFTFDQLAILEEEVAGDARTGEPTLGLDLARFTPEAIRRVLPE
ncbi:MAG: NAD-dependent epimerase/dehydratase family protein [Myxococcales bacterium]|nr:NAD-dependent epimerase/dehydratase family protein [Myxococcales bacterium]